MSKDFFTSLSSVGVLKLDITTDEFLKVMKDLARDTANFCLAKMNEERSPEFITRKEAKEMLKVTTDLTMMRWEGKGFLNPHRISGRVFYRKDEILSAFEKFKREEV